MNTKLLVNTEVGTFKRSTKRVYSHIVVVAQVRHEVREAQRLAQLASQRKEFASLSNPVAAFKPRAHASAFDTQFHEKCLADGSYVRWAANLAESIAKLEAIGPITEDATVPFGVLGWCGRLDLAVKLAAGNADYREARVYEVATGKRVR